MNFYYLGNWCELNCFEMWFNDIDIKYIKKMRKKSLEV